MMAAGRGVIGLLTGDRQAGSYFDLSQRGLAGSFIALLLIVTVSSVLPVVLGIEPFSIAEQFILNVIAYGLEIGFTVVVLRQNGRMDGFVPYVIVSNWVSFFVGLVSVAIAAAGIENGFTQIILLVAATFLLVNVCRIIVTLAPLQIAMLLVAQLVALALFFGIAALLFPLPPEVTEAAASGLAQ